MDSDGDAGCKLQCGWALQVQGGEAAKRVANKYASDKTAGGDAGCKLCLG
jgi:hypothetical protein